MFQRIKEGCKKHTTECVTTAFDVGLTLADFVLFGVEIKVHSDRIAAEREEFERRRNQTIEDQEVFLDELERIQQGLPPVDEEDVDRKLM